MSSVWDSGQDSPVTITICLNQLPAMPCGTAFSICSLRYVPRANYALSLINSPPLRIIPCSMRSEERERMYQLCALIEKEQDHHRFLQLIEELNELLERQEQRLEDKPPTTV